MSGKRELIWVKPSEVKPYINNPRQNDAAVAKVAESIAAFGFNSPIVVDEDMVILAGHTRWKAALKLELDAIPVFVVPGLTDEEKRAYRIADNRLGEFAEWDWERLQIELDNISTELADFLEFDDVGFPDVGIKATPEEADEIPEEVESEAKDGQIWRLGRHYLMCGDSTDKEAVGQLFEVVGKPVDMLLTDPPYGVAYGDKNEFLNAADKGNRIQTPIKNDQNIEDYAEFFKGFLEAIPFSEYNTAYIFMADKKLLDLLNSMRSVGLNVAQILVWVKNVHVLGRSDYYAKHELIVYGWKGKHKFYGNNVTTVLNFDKPHKSELHPTMKPVELLSELITHGSAGKDSVIYDPFLGSGSTLIAAELTGRQCVGLEIDPHYCDVIIKRWEELTGEKAELIHS